MSNYVEMEWDIPCFVRAADIPAGLEVLAIRREKTGYRGIETIPSIRKLRADSVNQDLLDRIAELPNLEYLHCDSVTAHSLSPLLKLKNLKALHLEGVRQAEDFTELAQMKTLTGLYFSHVKHLSSANFLSAAHHLRAIGIEGSMWTPQTLPSLKPLAGLQGLQKLFMTSVRLVDKDLTYLAQCPNLSHLKCARFAPRRNFDALRRLMPDLACSWCDAYDV